MKPILLAASLAAATALSTPALAVTTFDSLASWQGAVDSHVRDTAYGNNFTTISDVTLDGGAAIDFASPVSVRTIANGWATWSGGYTGQVLWTQGGTSLTATFASAVDAFGFFSQPNPTVLHTLTLTLSDGSSIGSAFSGNGGAGFLGWAGPGITGFTISSDVDFAIGDFYTGTISSAIPEPAAWLQMVAGFGVIGFALRRKGAMTAAA